MTFLNFFHRILSSKTKNNEPLDDVLNFMPKNPVIIEAGAHVGVDTIRMAKLFPKGKIYAFEPVNSLFEILKRNTEGFDNVKCFNLALGDKDKYGYINLSEGRSDASSSMLNPKEHLKIHPDVLFNKRQRINCVTLDNWCRKNNIKKIGFIWFDLQGLELQTLKHVGNLLNSVKAIYTEVSLVENYENGALYPKLKRWLENKGFVVKKEYIYWADGGNVLFIKN